MSQVRVLDEISEPTRFDLATTSVVTVKLIERVTNQTRERGNASAPSPMASGRPQRPPSSVVTGPKPNGQKRGPPRPSGLHRTGSGFRKRRSVGPRRRNGSWGSG